MCRVKEDFCIRLDSCDDKRVGRCRESRVKSLSHVDPVTLRLPGLHSHGREHVGTVIVSDIGEFDSQSLPKVEEKGAQIPGVRPGGPIYNGDRCTRVQEIYRKVKISCRRSSSLAHQLSVQPERPLSLCSEEIIYRSGVEINVGVYGQRCVDY